MWNIRIVVTSALSALLCACSPQEGGAQALSDSGVPPAQHVDAAGAARLLAGGGVVVLDVRTPREFAAGHIAGARLIDFNASNFEQQLAQLDRKQKYLVHCAVGGRSGKSLSTFRKLGFEQVVHLDGGMKAWQAAGQPVTK